MKNIRFTFLVDTTERQMIRDLAEKLQRSQGAAVRFILCHWNNHFGKEINRIESLFCGDSEE